MNEPLRVLDLFSGIGGISLGLERTGGFRTVAFCEIDPYCRAVLRKHWPDVPIFDDVRGINAASVPDGVDFICGGFPCQPFSVAGKQLGRDDVRHLWPEYARIVREFRPRWVLAENVPGLRAIAADEVLSDLEAAGYSCWPLVVGADDVGAPHRRKRVWIVARCLSDTASDRGRDVHRAAWRGEDARPSGIPRSYGAKDEGVLRGDRRTTGPDLQGEACRTPAGAEPMARWPARPGEPQWEWEEPRTVEPSVGAPTDGVSERLDSFECRSSLRAAGNSVVPQVVEAIGRAILKAHEGCAE